MKENLYQIKYKNGDIMTTRAYSMILKDNKVYQYPFDNGIPSIFNGSNIAYIKCIERNNNLERKQERETFVGFRPSVINHAKNYTRKQKHKKDYSAE